ncbi:hypothetical protein HaLaN_13427, partial [Haematococcus lacustris]
MEAQHRTQLSLAHGRDGTAIVQLLHEVGLQQYTQLMVDEEMTPELLQGMTNTELQELGVAT